MVKVFRKRGNRNRPIKRLIPFSLHNRTLTYRKLPVQQFLKLHVLKLDGSSFSINVARNATVAGLKFAVMEEFSLFPEDDRARLWALVWSHFCLCYEGQKLIHDVACIQKYGIKDGDQLCFIQHLRIDLAPTPKQSRDVVSPNFKRGSTTDHHDEDESAEARFFQLALPQPKSRLTASIKGLLSCSMF